MKRFFNEKGISFIEVIIASAILIGVAIGMMQLQKNMTNTVATAETKGEITQLVAEMRALLSNTDSCTQSLGGLDAVDTDKGVVHKLIQVMSNGDLKDRFLDETLDPDVRYGQGKIKIKNYFMNDQSDDVNVGEHTTNLFITFYRGKASVFESSVKRIKLWVEVDGGNNIVNCRALSATENNIWTRNETNQEKIYYDQGYVGVNVPDPQAQFHVKDGNLKIENGKFVFNDVGIWDGVDGVERQWMGITEMDPTNPDRWIEDGKYFHISGAVNENFGLTLTGNTKRVLGLYDDVVIPGDGRLWLGLQDRDMITNGYDFMGTQTFPRLYIKTAELVAGNHNSPDILFDDGWTNMIGTGRFHISAQDRPGTPAAPDPNSITGRLFLNPWQMSGDVYVGHGDNSIHNLLVKGSIVADYDGQPYNYSHSERLYVNGSSLLKGDVQVDGTITYNGSVTPSDIRYKKEIEPIKNPLKIIKEISGVSYFFRTEEFPKKNFKDTKQFGVIAQEVEKVLPEIVSENKEGFKRVDYQKLFPILIESIKELSNQLDHSRENNKELELRIKKLEHRLIRENK